MVNMIAYGVACARGEGVQVNAGAPVPMVMQQTQKHDGSVSVMTVPSTMPAAPTPVYAGQAGYPAPQGGYAVQGQPGMQQQAYVQQPVMYQQQQPHPTQ